MPGLLVTDAGPSVGVFGKLPALGDFLARDLEPAFTGPWFEWLEGGLLAARAALGDRFQAAYMQGPVWRFALPAGIAGGRSVTGVLMPSVDSVGRGFPLALVAIGPPASESWYDLLDAHARAALEQDHGPEDWLARLAELPAPDRSASEAGAVTFWGEGSPFVPPGELRFARLPAGADFLRLWLEPCPVSA